MAIAFDDTVAPPVMPFTRDDDIATLLRATCARMAPVWPLERFVAVNPYLGLTDEQFGAAARRLATVSSAKSTLPIAYYRELITTGRVATADIDGALSAYGRPWESATALLAAIDQGNGSDLPAIQTVPTVAALATTNSGTDWCAYVTDRISAWAAAYFDAGQALWKSAAHTEHLFAAWKADASIDRSPEIMGLRQFRATIRSLPDEPFAAATVALDALDVPPAMIDCYLDAVLRRVGGWAAHAARLEWEQALVDRESETVLELLVVGLVWEYALLRSRRFFSLGSQWIDAKASFTRDPALPVDDLTLRLVLQEAFDRSEQRHLAHQLGSVPTRSLASTQLDVQAVFCIDVRSEVIRRHLEATDPAIATLGFAGFFGMPLEFLPLAHDRGEAQLPVLLAPTQKVTECVADGGTGVAAASRVRAHEVRRAWKTFKMGAISCFSFVGPVGLAYLPKLLTDATGRTRPMAPPEVEGLARADRAARAPDTSAIAPTDRVALAEGALRGMSLVDRFAPLVLLTGHGSSSVNNPFATGLDCGACGGHSGEVSARVAADILNDTEAREGLRARGIVVPDGTWFVAALHDTTTDVISIFDRDRVPATHRVRLAALEERLAAAGDAARRERADRLGIDPEADIGKAVDRRSRDWAQTRPEWALAGCRAFIAAPRVATIDHDFAGRAFLHEYDRAHDPNGAVLEQIMTAPMVVASWISLQYYASTVDPSVFGAGDKTLHNVVARTGVVEGNGGDLRTGLPWQSVHDGIRYQHEPLRLQVVLAASTDAINRVLTTNDAVRRLCDNGWVQISAMDDDGVVTNHYRGDLRWSPAAAIA